MKMRAFFHSDQSLHNPLQYVRFGRIVAPKDLPERTQKLLGALASHGLVPEMPPPCGLDPVLAIHTSDYVHYLETAWRRWTQLPDHGPEVWPNTFPYWSGRPEDSARPPCRATAMMGQTGWYLGDLSVPMGPDTFLSALRSAETAVAAADAVLAGHMAYALCRPSGHHARSDRASGFCYFNNTAIAAQRLRSRFAKVAILDVDAHHGDGTQQIFYNRDDVMTVSLHADPAAYYPFFTGYADERGAGQGLGANLNLPLVHGTGREAMVSALQTAMEAIKGFGAEAIVVALGYDAHRLDPLTVLNWEAPDFGAIAAQVSALGLPTLTVQEGGYGMDVIGDCLSAYLSGLSVEAR